MWNSFRTDARTGITAEVITYPGGGGDEIHAWVARPAKVRADGGVPDDSVVADCAAALGWLKALPTSNGKVGHLSS